MVDFEGKVYVAPLTTVGNLPFRRIMKDLGADITCGEMALGQNLLKGQASEWALLKRHACEDVFGVQVAGGHPDQMTRVAELIRNEASVDFVDINMGCPIDLVCKQGMGSALMNKQRKVRGILMGMTSILEVPVTVKMRVGWDDKTPTAHKIIPMIQNFSGKGVCAVMIHGRSRLQRYTKSADWNYIREAAASEQSWLRPLPVIGNGDIMSWQDHKQHLDEGGKNMSTCAMVGRGALIKPWLPTEIKEKRDWDISATERLDILKKFVSYGIEHWGSDQLGVNRTRRFLLEWLSFTCRYIPAAILEVLPQRLNERPPPFFGRSDLETLLSSQNCADWIKISEMLLGPVPEGFQFEPKHKSNSYAPSVSRGLAGVEDETEPIQNW
ncbi:hypothetical protein JKP88DRAFT_271411 [Tribonema minus]|uniref:tRNA-dihydrouridine(47) synthase [NAD(P)(+)] n=1 Tax=Tribonema minus TaxID=303371 RepID=A0A835ZAB5_9STRA|nr:hypothetical protein JKP88DRAFT_271411 [Tribonema minus]